MRRLTRIIKSFFVVSVALIISTMCVFGEDEYALFLDKNSAIFSNNNIAFSTIRGIGWWLFRGLVLIASKCEELYDISFGMVDFTSYSKINNFLTQMKPIFIALMAVSLFALGITLIMNHEKKPKIIINICIAALCVTSSTTVFMGLNTVAKDIKTGFESVASNSQEAKVYGIVEENLFDLVYLDQKLGMKNIKYGKEGKNLPHAKITEENFNRIDYTEVLNPKSDTYDFKSDGDAEKILSKKVVFKYSVDGKDVVETRDVYNGFGWNSSDDADLANEFYYRYQLNVFASVLALLAVIVLYLAMSYKCVRIAFELTFARLLAYLYSAELSGGQKVAKILVFIRDSYILLLVTTLCIHFFYFLNTFITVTISSTFVQGVFILFAAFCVIDGPNLVEKLLGMDAGISSSTARMMAAVGAVRGATRAAMRTSATAKGIGKTEGKKSKGKDSNLDRQSKNDKSTENKDKMEEKNKGDSKEKSDGNERESKKKQGASKEEGNQGQKLNNKMNEENNESPKDYSKEEESQRSFMDDNSEGKKAKESERQLDNKNKAESNQKSFMDDKNKEVLKSTFKEARPKLNGKFFNEDGKGGKKK